MSIPHRTTAAILFFVLAFVPVCSRAAGDDTVTVSANDELKFGVTDIKGKVGQKLTIVLTNEGALMPHNLVLLKPGTDVTAFVASASARQTNEYLPGEDQASHMLAHTRLIGPGDEDRFSFTPTAPGVYEYVCTFPSHAAAGMRGKLTVQ